MYCFHTMARGGDHVELRSKLSAPTATNRENGQRSYETATRRMGHASVGYTTTRFIRSSQSNMAGAEPGSKNGVAAMRRALSEMPPQLREVVKRFYLLRQGPEVIMAEMHLSEQEFWAAKSRAKQKLMETAQLL
jgi:hypothetical protein